MKLAVGDKVQCPHGIGVVVGFERLDPNWNTYDNGPYLAPDSVVQSSEANERVSLDLSQDPYNLWTPFGVPRTYYGYVREFQKLEVENA